jgi:hypothetical protein
MNKDEIMPTIQVDFEVYKALTARRSAEEVTENDVLRELLRLPRARLTSPEPTASDDWVTKGVRLPAGTELRAIYKGQTYLARVEAGALVLNRQRFDSPSAAAMSITRHSVNGWTFWQYRLPGQGKWTVMKALREAS